MKTYLKKFSKYILLTQILAFMLVPFASALGSSIQSWHLVDSGKHLDWGGTSDFTSYLEQGTTLWNSYKSGVIRKDQFNTLKDAYIYDQPSDMMGSNELGRTLSTGAIWFNKQLMNNSSDAMRSWCATHELGHALGLEHNEPATIMFYMYVNAATTLTYSDALSYDNSYKRY